jgi:hypothetical protein
MSSGGGALVQLISSGGGGGNVPRRLCPAHKKEWLNTPCLRDSYEQCMENKSQTPRQSDTCMWMAYTECAKQQISTLDQAKKSTS